MNSLTQNMDQKYRENESVKLLKMLKEVVGLAESEEGHRLEKRLMEAEEGDGLPEVEEAESSGLWINLNQKILPTSLHHLRTMMMTMRINHLLRRDVVELMVQIWEGEVVEDGEDMVEDEEGVVEDGEELVAMMWMVELMLEAQLCQEEVMEDEEGVVEKVKAKLCQEDMVEGGEDLVALLMMVEGLSLLQSKLMLERELCQ